MYFSFKLKNSSISLEGAFERFIVVLQGYHEKGSGDVVSTVCYTKGCRKKTITSHHSKKFYVFFSELKVISNYFRW